MKPVLLLFLAGLLLLTAGVAPPRLHLPEAAPVVSYIADPRTQTIRLCWKSEDNQPLLSLGNLKTWLENRGEKLVFAMNAGMFTAGHAPQGLYIQDGAWLVPPDTASGKGNFYLKPNGIFYLTEDRRAGVCRTEDFPPAGVVVRYATQSGPMLVTGGRLHPAFRKGSSNLNIRNGVGILPDGRVLFAMSKEEINFYDFAEYFRQAGCREALYLDGYVSRTYLPSAGWEQTDGAFGAMVAVTER